MNKVIYTFLLGGDKLVSEMDLRQPRYTYTACDQFTIKQKKNSKI